jgi:hypothetical protein
MQCSTTPLHTPDTIKETVAMVSQAPARDFLLPRLAALVRDAQAAGIARDVAVAVLIDLVTSPDFDVAAPDPSADSEPHDTWQRDQDSIVVAPGVSNQPRPIGAQDEADFVKPFGWFEPS